MVSSSSSGQSFRTADPSPERQGTSDASNSDYQSASEHPLLMTASFQVSSLLLVAVGDGWLQQGPISVEALPLCEESNLSVDLLFDHSQ